MCGIYLTNIPYEKEEVKKKLVTIQFIGPYYTGVLKENNLIFGHLRLARFDLENRSNQPRLFAQLKIVFNRKP